MMEEKTPPKEEKNAAPHKRRRKNRQGEGESSTTQRMAIKTALNSLWQLERMHEIPNPPIETGAQTTGRGHTDEGPSRRAAAWCHCTRNAFRARGGAPGACTDTPCRELGHDKEVHEVAWPIFAEEYKDAAEVIVASRKRNAHRQYPKRNREPSVMDEDCVVLCQALYQSIGEEEWIKKAGQRVAGPGKVAWRKTQVSKGGTGSDLWSKVSIARKFMVVEGPCK